MKLLSNKEWQEYRNLQGRVNALERKMRDVEFDDFTKRHKLELGEMYIFKGKAWKADTKGEIVWGGVYYADNLDRQVSEFQFATRLTFNIGNWNRFSTAMRYGYTPVKVKLIKEHIEEA